MTLRRWAPAGGLAPGRPLGLPGGVPDGRAKPQAVPVDPALLGPRRQRILDLLDQFPGLNVDEVSSALSVQRTAAKHHLHSLARIGLIVRRRQGRHVLHFRAALPELDLVALCLFRVPSLKGVVEALHDHPTMPRGEIAAFLGVTPRTVRRALRQLERYGLAHSGGGRNSVASLHPRLHVLLGRRPWLPPAPDGSKPEDAP